jgi:hypothetical protein
MEEIGQAMAALVRAWGAGGVYDGVDSSLGNGLGIGRGARVLDERSAGCGRHRSKSTKIKGLTIEQGPVIASWFFNGFLRKRSGNRELKVVIQCGRVSAAQAFVVN